MYWIKPLSNKVLHEVRRGGDPVWSLSSSSGIEQYWQHDTNNGAYATAFHHLEIAEQHTYKEYQIQPISLFLTVVFITIV